jgi:hypothetical protein
MADDVSFTISANDQASKVVETVQKKIQNFGSDVAKLALGVAGPMALLQAGIGFVSDKWSEYKAKQQEALDAQKKAAEDGASSVYDEVKAQESLGKELDKNLAIMLAIAKVKKEDAKNTQDLILQENALIEEYLKSEEARGVTTGGNSYQESSDFQNQFVRNIQNASRDEKLAAAKAWAEKKAQEFYANKYGPNSTPESRAAIDEKKKIAEDISNQGGKDAPDLKKIKQQIEDTQTLLENGGTLTGEQLINDLKDKVRLAEEEYSIINQGQESELENAKALLELNKAKLALVAEQKKQETEETNKKAKDAEALKNAYKDAPKLTVSSLREIGGSFGRGDVSSSTDRQIELAQKQIDVLTTIAQNTAPKSDVGVSKPIGDTNFTDETE